MKHSFRVKAIAATSLILALAALPARLQQDLAVSSVETRNVSEAQATITWQTIVPGSSWVEYGLNEQYGQREGREESASNHFVQLSGLFPRRTYHYRLKSVDRAGNAITSPDFTFTTAGGSLDAAPPSEISDLALVDSSFNSVTLEWTATGDDGINGTALRYDIRRSSSPSLLRSSTWFDQIEVSGAPQPLLAGVKQRIVITELPTSATLYFAIRVIDDSNNISAPSRIIEATTAPLSFGAFQIAQVRVTNLSSHGAIIRWWTAAPASTELLLGKTTDYEIPIPVDTRRVNEHSMIVGGLEPAATYHMKVVATDDRGSSATTNDIAFTTP